MPTIGRGPHSLPSRSPPASASPTSAPSAAPDGAPALSASASSTLAAHDPAATFEARHDKLKRASGQVDGLFPQYQWDVAALDAVMARYGLGDAKEVVRVAIALDNGDRLLSQDELMKAGKLAHGKFEQSHRFSPAVLADLMKQRGIAEEGALLRAAKQLDDGDKILTPAELERAADVLDGIVHAHDAQAVIDRVLQAGARDDVHLEQIGTAEGGLPVHALSLPANTQPPKLRVLVTGGVHGNEPCGTGAAVLVLEQLLANPKLRDEVEFTIVPLVNPRSLMSGERRTPEDVDLNRTFDDHDAPPETKHIKALIDRTPLDVALDLHSGYATRNGFWVLHKDSKDVLEPAMARVGQSFPLLGLEGVSYEMESPGIGKSGSSGTLKDYAKDAGARWAMTVEATGGVSYLDQVLGEAEIVHQVTRAALGLIDD